MTSHQEEQKNRCICNHANPEDCYPKYRCACKVHGKFPPPEQQNKWEEIAAKIAQDAWQEDRYANFSEIIYQNIKFLMDTYQSSILEEVEKMKKSMKETHICRFNDGKQSCDCYLEALEDFINIIQGKI